MKTADIFQIDAKNVNLLYGDTVIESFHKNEIILRYPRIYYLCFLSY